MRELLLFRYLPRQCYRQQCSHLICTQKQQWGAYSKSAKKTSQQSRRIIRVYHSYEEAATQVIRLSTFIGSWTGTPKILYSTPMRCELNGMVAKRTFAVIDCLMPQYDIDTHSHCTRSVTSKSDHTHSAKVTQSKLHDGAQR